MLGAAFASGVTLVTGSNEPLGSGVIGSPGALPSLLAAIANFDVATNDATVRSRTGYRLGRNPGFVRESTSERAGEDPSSLFLARRGLRSARRYRRLLLQARELSWSGCHRRPSRDWFDPTTSDAKNGIGVSHSLAGPRDQRDRRANFCLRAGGHENPEQDTICFGREIDDSLVGLDRREDFACRVRLVLPDEPVAQRRARRASRYLGHAKELRHPALRSSLQAWRQLPPYGRSPLVRGPC